ncbi:MAG: hypothetical protein L6Q95_15690 [Planctomycetes bacterium]|nr:hypothetical protein [Planctomycetota bacterium]
MKSVRHPATTPAERLRMALDLHDTGVEMMRQNLRRRHPEASEQEIERLLLARLHGRPGAEHGDAVGRPRRGGRAPS